MEVEMIGEYDFQGELFAKNDLSTMNGTLASYKQIMDMSVRVGIREDYPKLQKV